MCWLYFAVLHQDSIISIDLSAFLNVGWRLKHDIPRLAEVVLDTQRGSRPQGDLPRASARGPGCGGRPIDLWKKRGNPLIYSYIYGQISKGYPLMLWLFKSVFQQNNSLVSEMLIQQLWEILYPYGSKTLSEKVLNPPNHSPKHFLRRYGWIHRVCPDVFDVSILKGKGWPRRQDLGVFVASIPISVGTHHHFRRKNEQLKLRTTPAWLTFCFRGSISCIVFFSVFWSCGVKGKLTL